MKVRVHVMLKPGVLDVQGKAVAGALRSLGYEGVENVRQGKYFTFDVASRSREAAERQVDEMCRRLLANTVIEDYRLEISDEASSPGGR
jgi:phosphoribosylformylglycinamidine synthase